MRRSDRGVLYLSHDWTPETEDAVTLEEVFVRAADSTVKVNVDLKEENLEKEAFQLAEQYQVKDRIILSGTVSLSNLTQKEIEQHLFYNIELRFPDLYQTQQFGEKDLAELIEFCQQHGITVINAQYAFCQPRIIQALRNHGIHLSAWTVNDRKVIKELFDQGIYNVTSKRTLHYLKGS